MAKGKTVQFPIRLTEKKYKALFRKAQRECNTASPAHDVLDLLLIYYLENTFILHRRMRALRDAEQKISKTEVRNKKIWMRLLIRDNQRFIRKAMKEGVSKDYIMNLLIDFYLAKEFKIETKIIRVNR